MTRKEYIVERYAEGVDYTTIAQECGITTQAVSRAVVNSSLDSPSQLPRVVKCGSCGTQDHSILRRNTKMSNGMYSYMCTPCNTKRVRAYRQTKRGRERVRQAVYNSIKKHPHKQRARLQVQEAVRQGKLVKPIVCEECQIDKTVEAHHPDYSKPLDIKWLCRQCHAALHRIIGKTRQPAI